MINESNFVADLYNYKNISNNFYIFLLLVNMIHWNHHDILFVLTNNFQLKKCWLY